MQRGAVFEDGAVARAGQLCHIEHFGQTTNFGCSASIAVGLAADSAHDAVGLM